MKIKFYLDIFKLQIDLQKFDKKRKAIEYHGDIKYFKKKFKHLRYLFLMVF